jgi:hypothetical protein
MDFSEQSHIKGEVYIYHIVLPLSDSMSVSTFSKFLWASGKPTCSCHIFYKNRQFPVCGYRHLAKKIGVVEGDNTIIYLARWIFGVVEENVAIVKVMWPLIGPILDTYIYQGSSQPFLQCKQPNLEGGSGGIYPPPPEFILLTVMQNGAFWGVFMGKLNT